MFKFIDNLQIQLPYKNIMTRLGARLSTKISEQKKTKLDNCISHAKETIYLKAVYKLFDIKKIDCQAGAITISSDSDNCNEETFISEALAKNLTNCTNVYIIGITAGEKIVRLRDLYAANDDTYSSVITDAVGSECVEAGIELLHNMLIQENIRQGRIVNKIRFSPGYQDLSLIYQHIIKNLIPLDKIGITVTDSAIMYPEKSITALIGVK